jgi:alpha-tubulin suppressor-like RCC1 family protein
LPTLIDDESTWIAVSAGSYHTVALKADGSLWAWGYNSKGQLGDGSTTFKKVPTQISTEEWAAVSAGTKFTVALKADGSLWTWGWNNVGQLGDGTVVDKNVPTRVGSDTLVGCSSGR